MMGFAPALAYVVPTRMLDVVKHLGLQSGLTLCLDAGDSASYSGSGQTWTDLAGSSYDFNLGSGSGSDSADPTFHGTAGRQSSGEYFSVDGADWLTLGQTNPTWVNNLHKASAKWSIFAAVYYPSVSAGVEGVFIGDNSQQTGFHMWANNTTVGLYVGNAGTTVINQGIGTIAAGWNLIGMSIDESVGSGGLIGVVNGSASSNSSTYSSPSSSSATGTLRICDEGNGSKALLSGSRIANLSMWSGVALSSAQLSLLYNATKAKFGL